MNKEWQHKDVWRKSGNAFSVEIVHWFSPEFSSGDRIYPRKEHWNIYAHLMPKHPLFSEYNLAEDYPEGPIPFHGGVTWFLVHRNLAGTEITSLEIGCDYAHCQDERFEEYATPEQAWEVFADAQGIFDMLNDGAAVK